MTETLNESYEKSRGIRDFLALIRNYQGLKELDATVINALIDKIDVYKRQEFCRCRESDQTYMDKLFIPIQGCLLEVVREQYTDFYRCLLYTSTGRK